MARAPQDAESPKDFGPGAQGRAARWRDEIELAQKHFAAWCRKCEKIERIYRAERNNESDDAARFAVFWSNIETLKPAVYARPPVPVVGRRFRDQDPIGRAAALIMRRNIQHAIDVGEVHSLLKLVRDDYLMYGRGTPWVRYEPHFDTVERPSGMMSMEGAPLDEGVQVADEAEVERVSWEEICWDFVHREDFQHGPGRTWADVTWVARRVRMSRDAGRERFGAKFRDVPLNWKPKDGEKEIFQRAEVWEIWDKESHKVYWIADGYDELLDEKDDPLELDGFFPCPKPLYGTLTTSSLVPVPDYVQYQDQAEELNTLTGRIQHVTESIQVRGAYDARFPQLGRIFDEGTENQLIPVEQYAEFASKGGLNGSLDFVPVEKFVQVLGSLIEARQLVKSDLYEITGIADIIRGSTQAEETATAQRLKGRYATLRLSDRQLEMARLVRDVLRITGEIIASHFSPETMALASNFDGADIEAPGVPPQVLFMQAIALLKDDRLRSFRIDVEDQSTIAVDDATEQAQRTAFLAAVGGFLKEAVAIPPAIAPALVPALGKMLMFGVRGFRIGADMEGALEDAMAKINQQVQQQSQAPPKPDPDEIKAQAEAQRAQMELQARQMEMQFNAQQAEAERALKLQDMQAKVAQQEAQNAQDLTQHQIAAAKQQMEMERFELERVQADRDYEIKLAGLELQRMEILMRSAVDAAKVESEPEIEVEDA